ncbi:unknown [Mycoplasma sp. CAG:877]|nr:unknown [Mycoplasma sp. CAG:877]
MSSTKIDKEISINNDHINTFKLELESGTKKMKEKFHKSAVKERNEYVEEQIKKFDKYQVEVYRLLKLRVNSLLPSDKSNHYDSLKKNIEKEKQIIVFNNSDYSIDFKLGIFKLISSIDINDDVSLNTINNTFLNIIKIFEDASIKLTISDFTYSMFTEKYMHVFLDNIEKNNRFEEVMKKCFDSIYWECPDIIKHLKLNFWGLLEKYEEKLKIYTDTVSYQLLQKTGYDKSILIDKYLSNVNKYNLEVSRDEFYNLESFLSKKKNVLDYLDGSATRVKNLDQFVIDGEFKDIEDSSKFYDNMVELAHTLSVLKLYYRYEFIIKDIQDKYSKKDANKSVFSNKLKEVKTEEGKRKKIYNDYLKACGKNLFHKVNEEKIKSNKLAINEEILKLDTLYNELHDLEIVELINKKVNSTDSLFDLFSLSYESYYYLEKMFNEHFKDSDDYSFEEELNRYFDFIYSPYNDFLKKINGFSMVDVSSVITDKYRLLGINVTNDNISVDNLDSFMDSVNYVKFIDDILKGDLSFDDINVIVKFREFEPIELPDDDEII